MDLSVTWQLIKWWEVRSRVKAAAAAKSLQTCPTLCDPIDGSPPGSPVPGILQARTLEWVAISSSNAWKWKVKVKPLSRIWLLATPWTAAYQAPPSMGFSRQQYWSGVPSPSPESRLEGLKISGLRTRCLLVSRTRHRTQRGVTGFSWSLESESLWNVLVEMSIVSQNVGLEPKREIWAGRSL